ncbi:MAG: fatty acid desaturase [Bacteriovoracaceae bacterium]
MTQDYTISQSKPNPEDNFEYFASENPHPARAREMIKKYPELKKYMGHYPKTALIALAIFTAQVGLGVFFATDNVSWLYILATAYLFGAFLHHCLFVIIHEAAHNLIFKPAWANKAAGIFCDFCQAVPTSISFRFYHLIHHSNMGEYDLDADLSHDKEAKLIGNSFPKKILWFLFFFVVEALRPLRLKRKQPIDVWFVASIVLVIAFNVSLGYFIGAKAISYLLLSTLFSVGLHPVGARWIQEHYILREGQQTYSYYGPLNKLALNVGYHNEHHDFFRIPWVHLPKITETAPEYYKSLLAYRSWSKLLWRFLTDKDLSLYSRVIVKKSRAGQKASQEKQEGQGIIADPSAMPQFTKSSEQNPEHINA